MTDTKLIENIEVWDVERLVPYARNARTHSDEQIAQIAASIREFGFINPILVASDGVIIAGHGRLLGAMRLGLRRVPVTIADHLTETQRRAYVIADNRLAENAGWDDGMLRVELEDLSAHDFDLELLGFDADQLEILLATLGPGGSGDEGGSGLGTANLSDRFLIPPFTVLNAREGWWQERKRAWIALGIRSELGRSDQLISNGGGMASLQRYEGEG